MQRTEISYLTHTYNPIKMRCTPVSRACAENGIIHCWHLQYCNRMKNNPKFTEAVRDAYKGGTPILDYDELQSPEHHKKPARIGTMFMGDLLHDSIDGFWISAVWGIMQRCTQHTFFILTKRPERFLKLTPPLPILENLWLGVSIEDQKTADERIPILLQIPAAHRWISIEPMLGSIKLPEKALCPCSCYAGRPRNPHPDCAGQLTIDWAVLGGETGPKARPMHPDWVRSIRDQCQNAGVKFFFKSWGEWAWSESPEMKQYKRFEKFKLHRFEDGICMYKIGHKNTGHLLDGKEYNEIP